MSIKLTSGYPEYGVSFLRTAVLPTGYNSSSQQALQIHSLAPLVFSSHQLSKETQGIPEAITQYCDTCISPTQWLPKQSQCVCASSQAPLEYLLTIVCSHSTRPQAPRRGMPSQTKGNSHLRLLVSILLLTSSTRLAVSARRRKLVETNVCYSAMRKTPKRTALPPSTNIRCA